MSNLLVELIALVIGGALSLYVVLGGADFGGGVWDLLASGPRRRRQRELIEHAIGPIWEANHVWLVFALVVFFTAFPAAFSSYMIALHVPITIALVGIVLRGSSFAFRSYGVHGDGNDQHRWGRVFAVASTVTPFLLGTCVGALAAGRVHLADNLPVNGFIGSWLSPFPLVVGVLTVALFSLLAAVYLTLETNDRDLREDFRRRALGAAVATGAIAAGAALLSRSEAPRVWNVLVGVSFALPFHLATGTAAVGVIWALVVRRYALARVLVVLQASFVLWGWFASQYPYFVVPDLSIFSAAAPASTLRLVLIVTALGAAIVFPGFYILYRTFKKFREG
ncbi:MAG: cytochrome d ubiquinol oxidase subunit II [Gemmatimonadetes bacterium]|nr:cytochrome d ubiquinol oxidase subunit II [Gemmatimonadota bacterium]